MLGRLNQRLKGKADVGAYNDLDRETSLDSQAQNRAVSPLSSFGFIVPEPGNGGLGSAIELSAAGAGVVPDGMQHFIIDGNIQANLYDCLCRNMYSYIFCSVISN